MLLLIGVMGGCYCWHDWCRGSCVQGWPHLYSLTFELFGCPCNPRQQWGWVRAALHPLVSSWDVGPRWAPAPGILQGNRVIMGELWQRRGVCSAPAPAYAQPLPALLAASSAVPLARCCPAFGVSAWTDVLRKGTLWESQCGPFAWCLSSPAGELWADHPLGLVDKAARLPKTSCGDRTVSGWKNRCTVFSC